ncbi:MAG TPA: AI-2E family transporter [Solirubrobacteraceae bacterium]|jgi:predicted PurR-regulated permease PerM|nr:AI-2E family transporter [Solirubrobacteraceae bacterium]
MSSTPSSKESRRAADDESSAESAEEAISAELASEEPTQEVLDDIRQRAETQAGVTTETAFGEAGVPFDRSSPFLIGFTAALGVALAVALCWTFVAAGQVLVLLGLAFFIAVGLDPLVLWLYRRGLPRWASVSLVVLLVIGLVGGFLALAVPLVTEQATTLSAELPHYLRRLDHTSKSFAQLDTKFHIVKGLQKLLKGGGSFNSLVGLGKVLLGFIASLALVTVTAIYLLVDLPRVRRALYLLAPRSRRPRMVLLTDEILDRVGGYVLGNLLLSLIAAVLTTVWALILGIPYAVLQGLLVGLLDLIPIVGSTIGGVIVSLVALTVSFPVALATAVFYIVYRFLEDYVLTPRIMSRTVAVPGLVTVIATVLGAALLGIVGALVAIPVAAAIKLLYDEIALPRLEES